MPESEESMVSKQKVLRSLKSAFDQIHGPARGVSDTLTHAELRDLRSNIALLRFEDLQVRLPQVLSDLLEDHADDLFDQKDIHYVVNHLDVLRCSSDDKLLKDYFGDEAYKQALAEADYTRDTLSKFYAGFTQSQCSAISEWLELASSLKKFQDFSRQMKSTLPYWKARGEGKCEKQ